MTTHVYVTEIAYSNDLKVNIPIVPITDFLSEMYKQNWKLRNLKMYCCCSRVEEHMIKTKAII